MRIFAASLLVVIVIFTVAGTTMAQETPEFKLGFRVLADLIPDIVGQPLESEWHNPENGDGLQRTTNGLMVWRKGDNWTAFTDGAMTWINGPFGLQQRANDERFPWEVPAPPPSDVPRLNVVDESFFSRCFIGAHTYRGVAVYGEIRNDGSQPRFFVTVNLSFPGNVMDGAPLPVAMILPGEKIPFDYTMLEQNFLCPGPGFVESISSSPTSIMGPPPPLNYTHDLEITNTVVESCGANIPAAFYYCVTGRVRNTSGHRLSPVAVAWAGYNAEGKVLWAASTSLEALDPDQAAPFRISNEITYVNPATPWPPARSTFIAEGRY